MTQPTIWVYDMSAHGQAIGKRHKMELPGPDSDTFPDYEYKEYPKQLSDEDGKPLKDKLGNPIEVNSADEEEAALKKVQESDKASPQPQRGPGRPRKPLKEGESDTQDDPTDVPADEQDKKRL